MQMQSSSNLVWSSLFHFHQYKWEIKLLHFYYIYQKKATSFCQQYSVLKGKHHQSYSSLQEIQPDRNSFLSFTHSWTKVDQKLPTSHFQAFQKSQYFGKKHCQVLPSPGCRITFILFCYWTLQYFYCIAKQWVFMHRDTSRPAWLFTNTSYLSP